MIPYTTPTLELVIDGVDLTEATAIVTLVQGEAELTITDPPATYDGKATTLAVTLTQQQSALFSRGSAGVQTKGGGIWTFGNYADESFVATYFSTSTIANTSVNYPDQQIEFNADGTTSGFTVSTSQVVNLLPVQLYNNTSGTTGTVTLSQSAANFTRLRVFFTTGNAGYGSTEIWSPNGKDFTCIGASAATSSIA